MIKNILKKILRGLVLIACILLFIGILYLLYKLVQWQYSPSWRKARGIILIVLLSLYALSVILPAVIDNKKSRRNKK